MKEKDTSRKAEEQKPVELTDDEMEKASGGLSFSDEYSWRCSHCNNINPISFDRCKYCGQPNC